MLPAGEKGAAPERERPDWQGRGGPWVPTQKCGVWNGTGGASEQVGGGWEELRGWRARGAEVLVLEAGSGNGRRLDVARFPSGSAWAWWCPG